MLVITSPHCTIPVQSVGTSLNSRSSPRRHLLLSLSVFSPEDKHMYIFPPRPHCKEEWQNRCTRQDHLAFLVMMSSRSTMLPSGSSGGRSISSSQPSFQSLVLTCNKCKKPLATTFFYCVCQCIFCVGKSSL